MSSKRTRVSVQRYGRGLAVTEPAAGRAGRDADPLAGLALALGLAGVPSFVPTSPDAGGSLAAFDAVIWFTSGGKDSLAAGIATAERARRDGVLDRVVAVHNDLGRIEWAGTRELAEEQARRLGVPFVAVRKSGPDLLDDIEARGMFPDAARRWCTSGHKREPGRVETTAQLHAGYAHTDAAKVRAARVLVVYGFRRDESTSRARKATYTLNVGASTQGTRHVYEWLPIHAMTESQVWAAIRAAGIPYHPAYRAGMSRLSCSFCVLASRADLTRAAQLRPDLAAEYVRVEAKIGHTFQKDRPIADVVAAAQADPAARFTVEWRTCERCGVPVLTRTGEPAALCPAHEPVESLADLVTGRAPACL